jgi:hypothetical protein
MFGQSTRTKHNCRMLSAQGAGIGDRGSGVGGQGSGVVFKYRVFVHYAV